MMKQLFLTSLTEGELQFFVKKMQKDVPVEINKRNRLEQLEGEQIKLVEDVIKKLLDIQKEIEELRMNEGQKCKKCNSFWNTSKKVEKCPFCGAYLDDTKGKLMEKGWILEDSVLTVAWMRLPGTNAERQRMQQEWAKAKKLVLCEGIAEIEGKFFKGLCNLEEIVFPTTLKKIGYASFQGCVKLKKIEIPEGVTHIEADAFRNCKELCIVRIPDTVKYIGNDAFYNCIVPSIYVAKDCVICQGNYQVRNRYKHDDFIAKYLSNEK